MKTIHLILGVLGGLGVGYVLFRPSEAKALPPGTGPAPPRTSVRVPVTAADLGKVLQADLSYFTPSASPFLSNPRIPTGIGPLRLTGGSVGPDGVLTRVDGTHTFSDGTVTFGSVPVEAVISVGPAVLPPLPKIPSLPVEPASFLFPDLAVGDVVVVDAKKAKLPSTVPGGLLGQVLMQVDLVLTDKNVVSAATFPVKTFSGTIPRDAIVARVPKTPPGVLNV